MLGAALQIADGKNRGSSGVHRSIAVEQISRVQFRRGQDHREDGKRKLHIIGPRAQTAEGVVAIGRSGGRRDEGFTAAEQLHRHVGHARFPRILQPIPVQVMPHEIAHTGRETLETKIHRQVGVTVGGIITFVVVSRFRPTGKGRLPCPELDQPGPHALGGRQVGINAILTGIIIRVGSAIRAGHRTGIHQSPARGEGGGDNEDKIIAIRLSAEKIMPIRIGRLHRHWLIGAGHRALCV